jgi:hypothetical protein
MACRCQRRRAGKDRDKRAPPHREWLKVRVLESITFMYGTREDRVLAAVNSGKPEAWSCWLTRRLALVLLERAGNLLASTSALAQRAPADIRGELVAFERDAAIAETAKAMSHTTTDILKSSGAAAELVERLTISSQGDNFRVELRGETGGGAAGMVLRAELQRILQMLQIEVSKADWLATSAKSTATPSTQETGPKPARH